jgi:outer membrane lipoprotein SlyB
MKTINATNVLLLIASAALVGCISNPPEQSPTLGSTYGQSNSAPTSTYRQSNVSRFGVIDSIDAVRSTNNPSGAGLVVGGLVGGLLGNQVGGGNGKTAATVIGAVGGAVVGNNIEQNRNTQSPDHYAIRVRMDNGDRMTVTQDSVADLRVGDRARVVDGRVYRD